jgi:exodeoxyribonuclease V alpha subunit
MPIQAGCPALETLSGLVERVTFQSEESGFSVLKVKVKGYRDLVTIVGVMPPVTAGEWIECGGRWEMDREHGQQFKIETIRTTRPDTLEGIERYLGSGLLKGIGPHFAKRLVEMFGADVFDIIEQSPNRLKEVDGIGTVRRGKITDGWHEQKSIREIMVFLHSHGVSTSRAFRIYKTYGDTAIEVVRENPYRLAHDIWGIGFKTADAIAANLGIDPQSDIRARAGVEYVLASLTEDDHCAFPRHELTQQAMKMLAIPEPIVSEAIDHALGEKRLIARHELGDGNLLFLASLDTSEAMLARNLLALMPLSVSDQVQ